MTTKRWLSIALPVLLLLATSPALAEMLGEGAEFPEWTLVDQNGEEVSSKDYAGQRYLLWFYPKASTPGCTAEGRGLRDGFEAFEKEDVAILGVSFDEPEENATFAKENDFPFPLLSDRDRSLAVSVGATDSPDRSHARRISYLVGADGKVLRAYDDVSPATHASEVLEDL